MGDRFISWRYELDLWWGLLPHFTWIKIKSEDETLEAWNFILKLFRPSFADLVKNLFGSSAARSQDISFWYGSQPKKCQNDVFLENRFPIDKFL